MAQWQEPRSVDEARRRKLAAVDKLNAINGQLMERKRAPGTFVEDPRDFHEWRSRAVAAKRHTEAEIARLNLWIKNRNLTLNRTEAERLGLVTDSSNPVELLRALYDLVHRLACEGVDLDPPEQKLKDSVRAYLDQQ